MLPTALTDALKLRYTLRKSLGELDVLDRDAAMVPRVQWQFSVRDLLKQMNLLGVPL